MYMYSEYIGIGWMGEKILDQIQHKYTKTIPVWLCMVQYSMVWESMITPVFSTPGSIYMLK